MKTKPLLCATTVFASVAFTAAAHEGSNWPEDLDVSHCEQAENPDACLVGSVWGAVLGAATRDIEEVTDEHGNLARSEASCLKKPHPTACMAGELLGRATRDAEITPGEAKQPIGTASPQRNAP
jgi:hypothetical protein